MSARPARLGRSFLTFLAGETLSDAGTMISTVALPLVAVQVLHVATFYVGLLEAVEWIPAVVIGLPVGALVDRHQQHCRTIMMTASAGRALTVASVPIAAALGVLSLPVVLGAAVATGVLTVFFRAGYGPYLRQLLAPGQLSDGNSCLRAGNSAARIGGPAIGGALVAAVGASMALAADAVSFACSLIALAATVAPHPAPPPPPHQRLCADIADGLRALRGSRLLSTIALAVATANFFLTASGAIEIIFLVRAVHLSSRAIGVLLTFSGIGGLTGALLSARLNRRYGLPRMAGLAFAVTAPASLLLPATWHGPGVVLCAVGGFVVSFGISVGAVALLTLKLQYCPPALLARVGSCSRMLTAGSIPIGALLGGAAGQYLGLRTALTLLACGYIAFGIALARTSLTDEDVRDLVAPAGS